MHECSLQEDQTKIKGGDFLSDFTNYIGKKVIIYDETNKKTIGRSVILEYDRAIQQIVVDSQGLEADGHEHVSVLVFGDKGLYEYKGTIRKATIHGKLGIALYKGKPKEDRAYTRYSLHASAIIEHLVIGSKLVSLRKTLEMEVINLSVNGILLRGNANLLNIGTSFELKLQIDGSSQALLNTTVVRIKRLDPETTEYGCKFNFQYK